MTLNAVPAAGDPWFSQPFDWSEFDTFWIRIDGSDLNYDTTTGSFQINLNLNGPFGFSTSEFQATIGHGVFFWATALVIFYYYFFGFHDPNVSLTLCVYSHSLVERQYHAFLSPSLQTYDSGLTNIVT
jgi:hypothetical protein